MKLPPGNWIAPSGSRKNDWCVCGNPKSHRTGLLTFEHQGCSEFEQECDQEPARANICQRSIKGRCVSHRPHNLKVNVLQLVEHRPGGVEELESYIAVLSPSLQEQ